jgi:hypothetical protein
MALRAAEGRRRPVRSLFVLGLVPVLVAGPWSTAASADEGNASRSSARFLSGDVLGFKLDDVTELAGVTAENKGDPDPVTKTSPIDPTALDSINVEIPGGVKAPLSDIIKLGAVNQWATANGDGTSHAAAGAVADNGGVGTGVDAGFPGGVTFDLTSVVGDALTDLIDQLKLTLGAVSSEAHLNGPEAPEAAAGDVQVTSDYQIDGGQLTLKIPAIADVVPPLRDAVGSVDETLKGLVGPDGAISSTLQSLSLVTSLLELIGADVKITTTLESDLQGALDEFLNALLGEGTGVEINLAEGTVMADLDVLAGGLNDQAPNTELLSKAVLDQLPGKVSDVLDAAVQDLVDALKQALQNATLNVAVFAEVTDPLLGIQLGTLDLSLNDTLGNIVNGDAEFANNSTGTVPALVAPIIATVLSTLIDTLSGTINDTIFGDSGVLAVFGDTAAGLFSGLAEALKPIGDILAQVLSIKVNVQPDQPSPSIGMMRDAPPAFAPQAAGGPFSVAALQVTVLPPQPVAAVTLAWSEVGSKP